MLIVASTYLSTDWLQSSRNDFQTSCDAKKTGDRSEKSGTQRSLLMGFSFCFLIFIWQIERDPRFSSLTGEFSPATFQKRYSFLADMHKTELSTLKENLKRARNMVRSSPRDQREARENEVQRLERAVKRLESSVNRDKRDDVESEALEKARKEEQQRRKEGKGDWYMKKSKRIYETIKYRKMDDLTNLSQTFSCEERPPSTSSS